MRKKSQKKVKPKHVVSIPNYHKKKATAHVKRQKQIQKQIDDDRMLARQAIALAMKATALKNQKTSPINKKKELLKLEKETKKLELKKQKLALSIQKAKELEEELKQTTSTKCTVRNPAPPCKVGFTENILTRKDGSKSKCCYKLKQRTTLRKCTTVNPAPPCAPNMIEKPRKLHDGSSIQCCYKISKQPKKSSTKQLKTRKSLFTLHDSLFEFDPIGEVRNPKTQLVSKLKRHTKGLLVSTKYDGHRMLYDNVLNEGLSRTGKTSFNLPDSWKNALHVSNTHLDGEIFLPGLPASQV